MFAMAIISLIILSIILLTGLCFSAMLVLDDISLPGVGMMICFLSLSLPIIFIAIVVAKYLV
jgi:hypothetical protein